MLGLVALGSTADPALRDEWSDHDFWVVTRPGHQDALLDDASWLPNADAILMRAMHGRRGFNSLYRDGHLAEIAVLDPEQVTTATVTVCRVLLDRGGVADSAARAQERARPAAWTDARREFVFDNFLMLLRTAVARWHRGERLSARRYLGHFATDALLTLALEHAPATTGGLRDPADPRRRIERQQPQLAAAVDEILSRPVPEGAVAMLELAESVLVPRWAEYPRERADAVRAMVANATTTPRFVRTRLVLAVRDLALATRYWMDALAFHRDFGDGSDGWSFLSRDECRVMLGECPDERPASELGDHAYVAYVTVDDADRCHAELASRGATISSSPESKSWGMRELGVRTPDGHRIQFGSPL